MSDSSITTERAFEEAIEHHLTEYGGYLKGDPKNFSRELALDRKTVFAFLQQSQPESWEKSSTTHGSDVESKIIQRLFKELDNRGTLDVLRHGFRDYGVHYRMAYFKPVSGLNPETQRLYQLNRLTITRQVRYSLKNENSIDMLLSLNGLPVAAVELKNSFTGQNVTDAEKQFMEDRDPRELLFQFKKRALVHFAVDTDKVYMTTKLARQETKYLPFNKGDNNGAGNPANPNGYKTAYLWEEVWEKDSWMDIIGRFLHLQVDEEKIDGKVVKKEKLIFPRYHQLDVVRRLSEDARRRGSGKNYLIQHSAGSGKSNSIAWLAYRLSSLHDKDDERVFDSVVVVTDRIVLDQQLQNTIYQFEHKTGVVQRIDKHSSQLAAALKAGTNIIITTLQKFPFVRILDEIEELPARNYAVIVDEAHSSQGGESADKMKEVLTMGDMSKANKEEQTDNEVEDDFEDVIRESMTAKGPQGNLSFFGFTATPKQKTLEVFGERNESGEAAPFHLYSMRQAIEERFIMDVLKNYVTYKTYFELSKAIVEDPRVNKKKAAKAIAKFVSLHPYNIAQKTEVMVEHFRQVAMNKIGGRAKAMVLTESRPMLLRYYDEFNRYINEKGYDIGILIAFSAFKDEFGIAYRESELNRFGEKQLPDKFSTDEYKLLLVADKYQTGFDQPLLHTMYVDKKLSGVKAVQSLSRLNRVYPGKEDTFVLDFANNREDILQSFQPYYEQTTLTESTDPNHLYDLKTKLEAAQVTRQSDIDDFCRIFFRPGRRHTKRDHAQLNAFIDPAVERYKALEDETQDDFKHTLNVYLRLYSFLSQIMPFQDIDLEKFYAYGRLLAKKLPKERLLEKFGLDDEVALEYYRLQKVSEGSIVLEQEGDGGLNPITDAGVRKDKEELAPLSEIIDILNQRFGTDFTEADRHFFGQVEEEAVEDETLAKQAKSNDIDNFKFGFEDAFLRLVLNRMDKNQGIVAKILDDNDFGDFVKDWMLQKVYTRLNE